MHCLIAVPVCPEVNLSGQQDVKIQILSTSLLPPPLPQIFFFPGKFRLRDHLSAVAVAVYFAVLTLENQ